MSDDYYNLLGVERNADSKTIKSAYRRLAMQYHPDRNPGDAASEMRFKQVSEAYEVLKDAQKRSVYDQYGKAAFEQDGFGNADFSGSFSDIFENIFGDFMSGGTRSRTGATRGADLRYDMEITLEEAFRGKKASLSLPISVTCEDCSGSGAAKGTKPDPCRHCHGTGKQRIQQGFFMVERTCPVCHGQGQIIIDLCLSCSGKGFIQKNKTLQVQIPAGVDQDTRIRLSGEGEPGARGGPSGDLYIFIHLKPHKFYRRDGTSLYCTVPLSIARAALGGEVEVPCLDGECAQVKIPQGTQNGRQFRVRGQGMPNLNSRGRGDLVVEAAIEIPINLSKRQKELMEEFQSLETQENSPQSLGFFSKIRDYLSGNS